MSISDTIIKKLIKLKKSNSCASYIHIKRILENQEIPVAFHEIKPHKIIRYRSHNDKNKKLFFESSEELSYREDILNMNDFGRANEPGQPFFYCNDNKNQNTGIAEIFSVFRGNEDSDEEILTIGAWYVIENLKLAMILPTDSNAGINKDFDEMKVIYNKKLEEDPDFKDFKGLKKLNEFLANEYTLDIEKDKSNYKITCAFSNYIKERYPGGVDGIMYASVKSELQGINIVLWPESVCKKLEFFAARKSVFKRKNDKDFIEEQIVESKSYEKNNDKIIWN